MSQPYESAFPYVEPLVDGGHHVFPGLNKRELFAAMAMQSALTGVKATSEAELPFLFSKVAQYSVGVADALLTELAK